MSVLRYWNGEWGFTQDGELVLLEDLPVFVAVNDADLADYNRGDDASDAV